MILSRISCALSFALCATGAMTAAAHAQPTAGGFLVQIRPAQEVTASETVSYTHLTLPTTPYV